MKRSPKKKAKRKRKAIAERPLELPRYLVSAIIAAVILFSAAIRVRLLDVPLERDEGEYAYAGQPILHGWPPCLQAYNMKLSGVYAAYAPTGRSCAQEKFRLFPVAPYARNTNAFCKK